MKLQKTEVKSKSASIKLTEMENQKLETLARNRGMKKSTLIRELVKIGFKEVAKKELWGRFKRFFLNVHTTDRAIVPLNTGLEG